LFGSIAPTQYGVRLSDTLYRQQATGKKTKTAVVFGSIPFVIYRQHSCRDKQHQNDLALS